MNRVELLIANLEKDMKKKRIQKKELYSIVTRQTVATLFNSYKGHLETLIKICEYVDKR